jgi:hypothetical protein
MYVQALLPLFIAFAIPHAQAPVAHGQPHSHEHHLAALSGATHDSTSPGVPAPHGGNHAAHGDCVLCLALQAGGLAALPALVPLPGPTDSRAVFAVVHYDDGVIVAAPVHYASRAPPQLG